jgi:hypothetical protein
MDQKQQIAERIKQANNILVTVSNNPSVDQLAACIGLTLALNKMSKHATALFSGQAPSTIEFLQPEKTLESNIDSLRDFIISLDKTKADKLRYKVEDAVVKIFITPYRTSLSEHDLEFGQGEFNVDVVLALGVHNQNELDQAISSHGRILHDATVATLNVTPGGELGSINWLDPNGSSLCELVLELVVVMDKQAVDPQIATALLTGIVAETDRFRNERTKPTTMSISAELMAAGANQQLVMTKLEEPEVAPKPPEREFRLGGGIERKDASPSPQPAGPAPVADTKSDDGTLEISHPAPLPPEPELPKQSEEVKPEAEESKPLGSLEDLAGPDNGEVKEKELETPKIRIDDQGALHNEQDAQGETNKGDKSIDPAQHVGGSRMILQPPSMGGAMSAGGLGDSFSDPLSPPPPESTEQPSGSPYSSPALASISPPSSPFMPPSMTPAPAPAPALPPAPVTPAPLFGAGPPAPAPFISGTPAEPLTSPGAPPDLASGLPPAHVDNARDAVSQALSFDSHAPSLAPPVVPQPLNDPLVNPPASSTGPPDLNIPVPAGPPPPVPPPMMPPSQ